MQLTAAASGGGVGGGVDGGGEGDGGMGGAARAVRTPNNIDFICPNIDIEYCSKSPKYCQYIDNIDLETAPNIDNILNIDSGISAQILNILKY